MLLSVRIPLQPLLRARYFLLQLSWSNHLILLLARELRWNIRLWKDLGSQLLAAHCQDFNCQQGDKIRDVMHRWTTERAQRTKKYFNSLTLWKPLRWKLRTMASHAQNSSSHRSGQRSRANQCLCIRRSVSQCDATHQISQRQQLIIYLFCHRSLVPACSTFRRASALASLPAATLSSPCRNFLLALFGSH